MFGAWSRPKNTWVRRFESEKEFWVERESFILREKWEKEIWNRIYPMKRKHSLMDWEFYLESIEYQISIEVNLSRCCWWQKHELNGLKHLSRRCRGDRSLRKSSRWIKKLSRCYQEETQKSWCIENVLRICQENRDVRRKARWIGLLSRIYREQGKEAR